MPADDLPTILATSGGIGERRRTRFCFTALTDFAVDVSGVTGGQKRYTELGALEAGLQLHRLPRPSSPDDA